MAYVYDLGETPTVAAMLNTGDTVTATVYNRDTGAAIPLTSSSATEQPSGSGRFKYTFAFTTRPSFDNNKYDLKLSGSLQDRWLSVDWNDNRAAYQDAAVVINTSSGYSGAYYPNGAPYQAVDNLADAITIAEHYGFKILKLIGPLTLTEDISGYTIQGVGSKELNPVTLNNQHIYSTVFRNVTITGTTHGDLFYAYDCWMNDITNVNAHCEQVAIKGNFSVQTGGSWLCKTGQTQDPLPVSIDCGWASGIAMSSFDGQLIFSNMSNPASFIVVTGNTLSVLMPTITAGVGFFGGVGRLTNNSTGTSITNLLLPFATYNELLTQYTTPGTGGYTSAMMAFQGCVWLDTSSGYSGTVFPVGTQNQPVNNVTDAKAIATLWNINDYMVKGTITLNASHPNWSFRGMAGSGDAVININNQNVDGSKFERCTITGACNGKINMFESNLYNVTTLNGYFLNTSIMGSITLQTGKVVGFLNGYLASMSGVPPTIDMNGATSLALVEYAGNCSIDNMSAGKILYKSGTGTTTLKSSCTGGSAQFDGHGKLVNNGTGMTITNNLIPCTIFEEPISEHDNAGTFGRFVNDTSVSVPLIQNTVDDILVIVTSTGIVVNNIHVDIDTTAITSIANAVWDEPAADHVIPDTMGKLQNTYRIARFVR